MPLQAENDLTDTLIRRNVLLQRLSAGERAKFVPFLKQMDKDIRKQLSGADLTGYTRARLAKFLAAVDVMLGEILGGYSRQLLVELDEIAKDEADFTVRMFEHVLQYEADVPSVAQLRAAFLQNPLSIQSGDLLKPFVENWTAAEQKAVAGTIRRGVFQGQTNEQIAQAIRGTRAKNFTDGQLSITARHANTVVHTAVQHVSSQARMETVTANDDIVRGIRWLSTLDGRTCQICRSLDRRLFATNRGPRPPIHPNCRCSFTIELKNRFKALMAGGERASIDGPVSAELSYYEWLKTQPASFIRAALGATRARLFLSGGLSLDRFAAMQLDRNFLPLTLAQMRELEPIAFERAGVR